MGKHPPADWHGTKHWQRHIREGTPLCDPCRAYRNRYAKKRRHALGESRGTWVYVPDPPELTDDHYEI
jgi:hypothetical protein